MGVHQCRRQKSPLQSAALLIELQREPEPAQHEAIGQLIDRAQYAFVQQPAGRKEIFEAAVGEDYVQLTLHQRDAAGPPLHTCQDPFSISAGSPGLHLLLDLLLAPASAHRFVSLTKPDIQGVQNAVLIDYRPMEAASMRRTAMQQSAVKVQLLRQGHRKSGAQIGSQLVLLYHARLQ